MNQPKRKRRLFSFSLRALLIFMLLLSCLFGWIGLRYRRGLEQQAILDRIEARGGTVLIGDDECRPSRRELFFDGNYIHRITKACFTNEFNPELVDITSLKNLRVLYLRKNKTTDLAPLAELKKLEVLYLHCTQANDLAPLSGLKNLRELGLDYRIDDKDVERLKVALPNCKIYYWSNYVMRVSA